MIENLLNGLDLARAILNLRYFYFILKLIRNGSFFLFVSAILFIYNIFFVVFFFYVLKNLFVYLKIN